MVNNLKKSCPKVSTEKKVSTCAGDVTSECSAMPMTCTVCTHPKRKERDRALVGGVGEQI